MSSYWWNRPVQIISGSYEGMYGRVMSETPNGVRVKLSAAFAGNVSNMEIEVNKSDLKTRD